MKTQQNLIMAWYKMMLNSSYGLPFTPLMSADYVEYDKNKSKEITKEGRKILKSLQQNIKKVIN